MTTRVWKYPTQLADWFELEMPLGAKVVAFGLDPVTSNPALWVEVDDAAPKAIRRFRLAGTGHPIEPGLKFIGSAIGHLGQFVWHLYEPEWGVLRNGDDDLAVLLQEDVRPFT